jgi:Winged helix DNA-binding domain
MTTPNVAVQRLHSQHLEHAGFEKPSEVVAWLGAMQAQDYAGAKWSVGLRLPDSTDAGIEQAIADNTFVRTWALRGTLHFVAAPDIRWLLALVAPRIIARNARRYRELELDEHTLARSSAVLADALQGGEQLDRTALLAILEQDGISTQGQRAAYILQRASLDGLICQGVVRRNNPTYMSLDESLPEARTAERDEAVAELARRYFTSRSPATLQDFVWWSGLSTADARAGLEATKPQLVQETIDGRTYWLSRPMPENSSSTVYLLPGFDEYLLSYRDRSASLDVVHAKTLNAGGGVLSPTIVAGGRVVGAWKRTFKKDAVVITVSPFAPLSEVQNHALSAAVERYGRFVGMPVSARLLPPVGGISARSG